MTQSHKEIPPDVMRKKRRQLTALYAEQHDLDYYVEVYVDRMPDAEVLEALQDIMGDGLEDGASFEHAEEDAEVIENLGDCPVCDGHLTLDSDGLTHCPSCGLDYADEGETA